MLSHPTLAKLHELKLTGMAKAFEEQLDIRQPFSEMSFDEFKKGFCAPRADFGPEFKRRFRKLPDLP